MALNKHGIIDFGAPRHLFKYSSISKYSLENLRNRKLWASKPTDFNDPFEMKYNPIGENLNKTELELLISEIDEHRILCFTEEPLNILMWSHYADQHKGMCLGFYNEALTYPVNYTIDFTEIDFNNLDGPQRIIDFLKITTTKSLEWAYEKERRMMFVPGANPFINYPGKLLMIAFGLRTPQVQIDEIKAIIMDEDVMFYKCEIATDSYKLIYTRI